MRFKDRSRTPQSTAYFRNNPALVTTWLSVHRGIYTTSSTPDASIADPVQQQLPRIIVPSLSETLNSSALPRLELLSVAYDDQLALLARPVVG
jgi:hypothetical protein